MYHFAFCNYMERKLVAGLVDAEGGSNEPEKA